MKLFTAKMKRTDCEVEYRVWAEDEKQAREKLAYICGDRNIKIKEM